MRYRFASSACSAFAIAVALAACAQTEHERNNEVQGGSAGVGGATSSSGGAPAGGRPVADGGASYSAGNTGVETGGTAGHGGVGEGGEPGVGGDGNAHGGTSGATSVLRESSWDTTLVFWNLGVACRGAAFTMHVIPSETGLDVILGAGGETFTGHLSPDDPFLSGADLAYRSNAPLGVPVRGGDCSLVDVHFTHLLLYAWDDDLDGVADVIDDGDAMARGTWLVGDVRDPVHFLVSWYSKPDATKPWIIVPTDAQAHDPLSTLTLFTTEPVTTAAAMTLDNESGTLALIPQAPEKGYVTAFSSDTILPFGSSWKVNAAGTDLAGLKFNLHNVAPVATLADPGVFAQDGFESSPNVLLSGARIVTGVGNVPAIQGAQSLFVPQQGSATLHLLRPEGARRLRARARVLMQSESAVGVTSAIDAGVVGGTQRLHADIPNSDVVSATGDAEYPYAGETKELSIDLAESGPDVVVAFHPTFCLDNESLCPPPQALLIDDLRVE